MESSTKVTISSAEKINKKMRTLMRKKETKRKRKKNLLINQAKARASLKEKTKLPSLRRNPSARTNDSI